MPGPVPKAEHQLTRPRSRRGGDQVEVTRGTRREVTIPDPDPNWHSIAKGLYESVTRSGQSDFYQDSDWWLLYSLCEDLSLYKYNEHRRSGQMLQTLMSAFERLLIAEGDRRRVRIELTEAPTEKPQLAVVAKLQYADVATPAGGVA